MDPYALSCSGGLPINAPPRQSPFGARLRSAHRPESRLAWNRQGQVGGATIMIEAISIRLSINLKRISKIYRKIKTDFVYIFVKIFLLRLPHRPPCAKNRLSWAGYASSR
jgi:hypothetical protein